MKLFKNEVVRIKDSCYSLIEYVGCNDCDFKGNDYCKLNAPFTCLMIYNSMQIPIIFRKYDSII